MKRGWRLPTILVYTPILMSYSGPWQRVLQEKLSSVFAPSHLELLNESPSHGLPPEAEKHFRVILVTELFDGLSRVDRYRQVHEVLKEELSSQVHALSLQLFTPSEWRQRQGATFSSPACLGGGKKERD